MADIYLDPITGDMVVTNDIRFTEGVETVVQKIELRLSAIKDEYRYDLDNGVDYLGKIWGQKPSDAELSSIFRKVLIETPGVDSVTKLVVTQDRTTRESTVDWQVKAGDDYIDGSRDI